MTDLTITATTARCLAVARQHLTAGPKMPLLDVIRNLGCLQLDPISAVARSHELVLWSRVGEYDLAELDTLLYDDRVLFEYWAHVASIVLTEEYPIHAYRMQRYPEGDSAWKKQLRAWWETPEIVELHADVLAKIQADGPVQSRDFNHVSKNPPWGAGWTGGNIIPRLFDYMWHCGEIMVSRRQGIQRIWDISERCLPDWTPDEELDSDQVTRRAAQKAIRALGVATPAQIKEHYTRRRYYDLGRILKQLEAENRIRRVHVEGVSWNGNSYVHVEDLPLLEKIESGDFAPRTALLSPFDNLICDRKRTEQLFDFHFRIEIYVPKAKRQHGYYVLPILQGDRFIGRLDPRLDRKKKTLHINAVYSEDGAPDDPATVAGVREQIESLARFASAEKIVFGKLIPPGWTKLAGD